MAFSYSDCNLRKLCFLKAYGYLLTYANLAQHLHTCAIIRCVQIEIHEIPRTMEKCVLIPYRGCMFWKDQPYPKGDSKIRFSLSTES